MIYSLLFSLFILQKIIDRCEVRYTKHGLAMAWDKWWKMTKAGYVIL